MSRKFQQFFEEYSANVDNAKKVHFWKLSDYIIETILAKHLGRKIKKNIVIFDAGGGTGRWVEKLAKVFPCNYILYDLSDSMLEIAKKKKSLQALGDKLRVIKGNLENISAVNRSSVDHIISIYNPISFVGDPSRVFSEFYRILRKNGLALVMGQGYYNAIFSKINNYLATPSELDSLYRNREVCWNEDVPKLKVFTKEALERLASTNGFAIIGTYGIPIFAQPKIEDFDPKNKQKSSLSQKLEKDSRFFKKVFDIEMLFNSLPTVVNRGMNIMIVMKKK